MSFGLGLLLERSVMIRMRVKRGMGRTETGRREAGVVDVNVLV